MDTTNIIVLNGSSSSGKSRIAKELAPLLTQKRGIQFDVVPMATFFKDAITSYIAHHPDDIYTLCDKTLRIYYMQQFGISWEHKTLEQTFASLDNIHKTMWENAITALLDCIKKHLQTNTGLILETILATNDSFERFITAFHKIPVAFIKLDCNLAIIEEREHLRKNRPIGWASIQYPFIQTYKNMPKQYDFSVDSTERSTTDCAHDICNFLQSNPPLQAMQKNYELIQKT